MAEEGDFEEELIKKVIMDVLESLCDPDKNQNATTYKDFSKEILDNIYRELHKLHKLFKYSVTVFLQQKVGAAVNFGSSMYADSTADGQVLHFYTENKFYDIGIVVAGYKITQK